MKIHKEGFKIIPVVILILIIVNGLIYLTHVPLLIFLFGVISLVFLFLTVYFFRDPQTKKSAVAGEVLSVADGKVVVIEPVFEKEYFKDERIQVSVFMSVFNVHINHVPVDGTIVYSQYHKGKFFAANLPKSSEENERATTVIRTADGTEILVRQIAGLIARRVVTYKKTGDEVSVNDQLGFIRFGSRIDLFFPKGTQIPIELGQTVKGGITVLGKLKE